VFIDAPADYHPAIQPDKANLPWSQCV